MTEHIVISFAIIGCGEVLKLKFSQYNSSKEFSECPIIIESKNDSKAYTAEEIPLKFPISHSETICESGDEEYVEEFVSEDSYDMDDEHDYVPPKHKNRNKFQENPGTVNATIKNRGKYQWQIIPTERDPSLKYQCDLCPFGATQPTVYLQHMYQHTKVGSFERDTAFYNCTACDEEFISQKSLITHFAEKHNDKVNVCPHCKRVFSHHRPTRFITHVQNHDEKNHGQHVCATCGIKCNSTHTLNQHISRMGPFHNKTCVQCDFTFETWKQHQDHVELKHDGIWKYSCGNCDKTFDCKDSRADHRRTDHTASYIKRVVCDYCGKSLTVGSLKIHIALVHSETVAHPCPICGRVFKHKYILTEHIKKCDGKACSRPCTYQCAGCRAEFTDWGRLQDHKGQCKQDVPPSNNLKPSTELCQDCGATFQTTKALKYHLSTVHSDRKKGYTCKQCNKTFKVKAIYRDHVLGHDSSMKFQCRYCDAQFKNKMNRSGHEVRNCPNRTYNHKHICTECGKSFKTTEILENHKISTHLPDHEKPYQCSFCKKGFARKKTLEVHENTHTNARPFSCRHNCGVAFNNEASRNQHERKQHGDTKGRTLSRLKRA